MSLTLRGAKRVAATEDAVRKPTTIEPKSAKLVAESFIFKLMHLPVVSLR